MNTSKSGMRAIYDEALESNNTAMIKACEKMLKKIEVKDNIHKSIIERFKNNQIYSVCVSGKIFYNLNEYLKYYDTDS